MRKVVLAVGLLLILGGIYLVDQGPEVLFPLAQAFGQVTHTRSESVLFPKTLLTVPPSSSNYMSTDLKANEQVLGSVDVADAREVAFYIMDEGNFSLWKTGQPSTVLLGRPGIITFNFTFVPNRDGTYYFVFVNEDTSRRLLVFSLDEISDVPIMSPVFLFAGFESFLLGILFAAIGAFTGGKKARIQVEAPESWKCKYCGERNLVKDAFCVKCKRARA